MAEAELTASFDLKQMHLRKRIKSHLDVIRSGDAFARYKKSLLRRIAKIRAGTNREGYVLFQPYPDVLATLKEHDDLTLDAYVNGLDQAIVTTVQDYLKPGMTVVDVGANVGLYTLLFAKLVGPTGRVYAFEPIPHLRSRIQENALINDFSNITTYEAAVGSRSERINLYLSRFGGDGWASIYEWTHAGGNSIEVDVVTLDGWSEQIGLGTVDLLKVDVEGAELDVYRGAERMLSSGTVKAIITEFNKDTQAGARVSSQDLREALLQNGYEWYALPWTRHAPKPVDWKSLLRLCDLIAIRAGDSRAL